MSSKRKRQKYKSQNSFFHLTSKKAILIIAVVGILVFGNALFNGFAWDDGPFILDNKEVHSINFSTIFGPSIFNSAGYYRVIPAFYFSTIYSLFNTSPFIYHFLQFLIHVTNVFLVFVLFKNFFKKSLALLLSLVFLVHPIQVESVSYIGSTGNPLYFLFGISALILALKSELNLKRSLVIAILLLFSILTKEAGLLFFVIIFLYRLLLNRSQIIKLTISLATSFSIYALLRFFVGNAYFHKISSIPIAEVSLQERMLNIPAIILYYIKTLLYPAQLAIHQQWIVSNLDYPNFYLPLLFSSIFLFATFLPIIISIAMKKNIRTSIFFFLWFILSLLLIIQLFPLDMTVADRWFYFPLAGFLALLGVAINPLLVKSVKTEKTIIIIFIIIIIAFSTRSIIRNQDWKNNLTLFSHDREIHTNDKIEADLGLEYAKIHQFDKAIDHFKKSIKMRSCEGHIYNLALAYDLIGDHQKALSNFYLAKDAPPCKGDDERSSEYIYQRISRLLILQDKFIEAKQNISEGLKLYPESGDLWALLAISKYNSGDKENALKAAQKATEILPNQNTYYIYNQITKNQPIRL